MSLYQWIIRKLFLTKALVNPKTHSFLSLSLILSCLLLKWFFIFKHLRYFHAVYLDRVILSIVSAVCVQFPKNEEDCRVQQSHNGICLESPELAGARMDTVVFPNDVARFWSFLYNWMHPKQLVLQVRWVLSKKVLLRLHLLQSCVESVRSFESNKCRSWLGQILKFHIL